MNTMIEALFDGKVFHPIEPFTLTPDTRVRIFIETDTSSHSPFPKGSPFKNFPTCFEKKIDKIQIVVYKKSG